MDDVALLTLFLPVEPAELASAPQSPAGSTSHGRRVIFIPPPLYFISDSP
jgi:hypothetical protein